MITYCGLDVHKSVVEACVLDAAGAVTFRLRFTLTAPALEQFCKDHLTKQTKVALEATTNTWAVVRLVRPHVAEVVVSNPMQTKAIAQAKVKTDKVDALILAQLLRCDFLPAVWQPDETTQRLRSLTGRRSALVGMRTEVKNRLHSMLAQRLLVPPADLFSLAGQEWLKAIELDEDGDLTRQSDLRLLDAVEKEIQILDKALAKIGYNNDSVKLLMTLPGVDAAVALALEAALGDVGRFRDGAHAAAYLGLAPSVKQSADKCYRGPITKRGNAQARWMLVQAAQHVGRHPGPLGHFFRKLAKKKNRNVAVVAVARKLAVIAWHMLTKREPYRYAQPDTTERKLQRLRVKATGEKRPTGSKPGVANEAKLGPGTRSRTTPPLEQVLKAEGLPAPSAPPPGEARTVEQAGSREYVESIQKPKIRARKRKQTASGT